MEVNVNQAIKIFFSKSSFEMIYMEAFANALDANATQFNVSVELDDYSNLQNLKITIEDNGEGFTDKRYSKFSKLLDVEEKTHKGLGRLVYLCYFDKVSIISFYDKGKKRTFEFTDDFDGKSDKVEIVSRKKSGSKFILFGFNGDKLSKNINIKSSYIKRVLLENFIMRFYEAKLNKKNITVNISSTINGKTETESFDCSTLPDFKVEPIDGAIDLFDSLEVYYHISDIQDNLFEDGKNTFITALSIDDRCFPVDLLSGSRMPEKYNMIFLLRSSSLQGTTDGSRQSIKLAETTQKELINFFKTAVFNIITREVSEIAESNKKQYTYIQERFPHLIGMIDEQSIGYVPHYETLKQAQDKFFKTERELLGASELTDDQLEKSIEFSSRTLAAYIIYRQKLIEKMLKLDKSALEVDLHNLLAPRFHTFSGDEFEKDAYINNLWVLDDKFMTYEHVLSEADMKKVIGHLNPSSANNGDDDRPDIAIFFSRDPSEDGEKFDMVIVELKRLGLTPEMNSIVELQLDKRTQLLSEHYGNRIQRAWYYGIVEMTDEYRMHLKNNEYKPLFSHGNVYYKVKPVFRNLQDEVGVIQHSYILDYKSIIEDANARNSAFLRILKDKFSQLSEPPF